MSNNEILLNQIKDDIINNLKCELKDNSVNLVFGNGNPNASVLFIGEAPGEKEDLEGVPFVGRAGKELNKLLNMIELNIEDVYIANILKYRPPKNRDPTNDEIRKHTPYLIKQIQVIKPKIIVTLGNYATKFVLAGFDPLNMNKIQGISILRGKLKKINFRDISFIVLPIYHPAAMLYRPQLKKSFEEDFHKIKKIIEKNNL